MTMPRLLTTEEREARRAEIDQRYDDLEQSVRDIIAGLEELNDARERYRLADSFYDGEGEEVFASQRVRRLIEKSGADEVDDLNYAAIPVDVVANRLIVSSVVAAPAEEDDAAADEEDASVKAATKAIARMRKRNESDAEEKNLLHLASRHGDSYLLVWPVFGDNGEVSDVDMRVNSAHNVRMIYEVEDPLVPAYVIKSWETVSDKRKVVRVNLYYPDRIERWATEPGAAPDNPASWHKLTETPDLDIEQAAGDGLDESGDDIPNPFDRVPWFHFRNGRPYGRPEHERAYGPQEMINKLVVADAAAIDFQSFPQRWLLQDPMADDPLMNLDDPDHPDEDEDDPETETGTAGLSGDPGSVWKLWGKMVGQFEPASAETFLTRLDRYIKSMAELTDTPQHAFSKSGADMPSGEAVRELNGPMYSKVRDRQKAYDPVLQDAYEFALRMLGIEGVTVDVRWEPIEVINDSSGWGVIKQKIEAGVPARVALQEAGYADEQIEEWLADLTGADMMHRVAIIERLGTAAQAFAAAVTAGVVSETTAQALFDRFLRMSAEGTEDPEKDEHSLPAPKFREPPPVNPAEAAAKAAQDFPAPPPKLAVDPESGRVPENPAIQLAKMGAKAVPPGKRTPARSGPR